MKICQALRITSVAFGATALSLTNMAQWNTGGGGQQYLSPPTLGVRVGTTTASPPSALTVNGDEMSTPTGEVFRTRGPNNADNLWRLERGNLPVGDIFSLWADENFHVRANVGDLRFWTNDMQLNTAQRARLKKASSMVIGSYGLQPITGHFGVGEFDNALITSTFNPFTMLHVDLGGTNDEGFRPGMREGMSSSIGDAYGYVGLLYESSTSTNKDYGIGWSREEAAGATPSRLRFIYTGTDGTATTASTADGLELGRFEPDANLDEGYFGLGDWTTAALTPNERLDVLDGAVKVRDLPTVPYQNDLLTHILVVEDAGPNAGKLKWRDVNSLPGALGTDCRWGNGVSNAVVTAVNGVAGLCRDQTKLVGIGIANPAAKFHVYYPNATNAVSNTAALVQLPASTAGATNIALQASVSGSGNMLYGTHSRASSTGTPNSAVGVHGEAIQNGGTASFIRGVYGYGVGLNSSAPYVAGVYGHAQAYDAAIGMKAVHGKVQGAINGNDYAGYFEGDVWITGSGWINGLTPIVSDANLKTNIEPLQDAGAILGQLHAKTYTYDVANYGYMGLPATPQIGLLAQEVEQVLPAIVDSTIVPQEWIHWGT
ncbi:MAG: tail fiber domain-containing protein [Flavobacteriales bacterium]|nr:tail fiber domain-containing protein [Flavobacteriales bacterium]